MVSWIRAPRALDATVECRERLRDAEQGLSAAGEPPEHGRLDVRLVPTASQVEVDTQQRIECAPDDRGSRHGAACRLGHPPSDPIDLRSLLGAQAHGDSARRRRCREDDDFLRSTRHPIIKNLGDRLGASRSPSRLPACSLANALDGCHELRPRKARSTTPRRAETGGVPAESARHPAGERIARFNDGVAGRGAAAQRPRLCAGTLADRGCGPPPVDRGGWSSRDLPGPPASLVD